MRMWAVRQHGLLTELEPVVAANLDRHLSLAKDWQPQDYVPWSRGRDFAFLGGTDWQPEDSPLDPVAQTAMIVNLLHRGTTCPHITARSPPRVLIPVVVAVALLIGCGVFAAVKVSHHNSPNANPTAALPPNTGPFTGTYRADFAAGTGFDGQPREGLPAAAETWGVRSVCRPGCVATASRRSGDTTGVSTLVFDYVGGSWLAVGVSSGTCQNTPSELWKVITLNSRPDSTLSGDFSTTTINTCNVQRAVTFTRTGDVDVDSLPDPATQAPRLHSAAEGLQGHYHDTQTYANGSKLERDVAAHTDCLRAGDRCMSFFHGPDLVLPLVFGGGNWTLKFDGDSKCPSGDSAHLKITAEYPLPQPSQDPITLLTGHGQQEKTVSSCSYSLDFDQKFVRTGD